MGLFGKVANVFGLRGSAPAETVVAMEGDFSGTNTLLEGNGGFAMAVVGESHYQSELEAICGPRSADGEDRVVEARLFPEDDNAYDAQAVRVEIAGHTVGYLSRPAAREYRAYVGRYKHPISPVRCRARIRGGWERAAKDRGHYGVWLDLPEGIAVGTATVSSSTTNSEQIRIAERVVSELLGLCKGMICDGLITDAEAAALRTWLVSHPDARIGYPGNVLTERLTRIFADHQIEPAEREELQQLLSDLTGISSQASDNSDRSTSLPFDNPVPQIQFDGREYVFTGRFAYGSRTVCERAVVERGGRVHSGVRKSINYRAGGSFS